MSNLDFKINRLKSGDSFIISTASNIVCSVERSGDGKRLRFVRTFENGSFEVYLETSFYTI
ncbi:MAG TPA: hypothetical protein PLW32_09425 [Chitinophagaceae bacterium]|jgi:hypothetical protein|nr:hypothetical protein [Chitinophagaceae bacterium]